MAYHLEGRLLEVCNCRVLCPCWIGEDPDFRHLRHHRLVALRQGHDQRRRRLRPHDRDDRAHSRQHPAGQLARGGLSRRQGERRSRRRRSSASIPASWAARSRNWPSWSAKSSRWKRCRSSGTSRAARACIKIGDAGYAELEPYKSASGATTTLTDTVFSTVPGAPVFVGKSPRYRSKNDKLGINLDMSGHNALQSTFVFDA